MLGHLGRFREGNRTLVQKKKSRRLPPFGSTHKKEGAAANTKQKHTVTQKTTHAKLSGQKWNCL